MVTWLNALAKTRDAVAGVWNKVFRGQGELDDLSLEELEYALLKADLSMRLVTEWTEILEKNFRGLRQPRREVIRELMIKALGSERPFTWPQEPRPYTVLLVGVNGSGKTTTSAKLAWLAKQQGLKPLLAATDTYRAAGTDQLRIWADRVGCDVVAGHQGADAAAVAFDALDAAYARSADVVIIDTAGRMHTKQPLMNELDKLRRAIVKRTGREPDETWMVLDAALGQNAVVQARQFNEATPLTGTIIAKLDGSAKAGFIFSIVRELAVPVRFAGLGEGMADLQPFEATALVDALLGLEMEPAP